MNEHEAIVRELAERGPFLDVDTWGDCGGNSCADCQVGEVPANLQALNDPDHHEPSCLWRRAKALYPGVDRP